MEYFEQISVNCTSEKYELACLVDQPLPKATFERVRTSDASEFNPHAAPSTTNLKNPLANRWFTNTNLV
jgi:hypothetical protein